MANVLVADDDVLYRGLIIEALRFEGHTIQEAYSAQSALRLLKDGKHTFDVVLCDLQMDGLDGLGLIKTIRMQYPQLPVVVVSAHVLEGSLGEQVRTYATHYLSKPFNVMKLLGTIHRAAQNPVSAHASV